MVLGQDSQEKDQRDTADDSETHLAFLEVPGEKGVAVATHKPLRFKKGVPQCCVISPHLTDAGSP